LIIIRAETTEDIPRVRRVNELAFGRTDEADLVDALRSIAQPYISLVAELNGQVVGHIFFSPVALEEAEDSLLILGLAPVAVLPEYQNRGIGSQLVREGLKECQRVGCWVVVVLGHPRFYPRFGFVQASRKGLRCEYPVADEDFMVAELRPNALRGRGLVKYLPQFDGL